MRPVLGTGPFAIALCKALGLDPAKTRSIEIYCAAGEVVTVNVERYVVDGDELTKVLDLYHLVPAHDEVDVTNMTSNARELQVKHEH